MMRIAGHQMVHGYSQSLAGSRTLADRRNEVVWRETELLASIQSGLLVNSRPAAGTFMVQPAQRP
ncbi:hypothetical protein [Arthrobacter zhaoguopingii]|uniref:hypothetical protein n=1 Tax=Arthrobacter zhaoguopingii TaxID=2681491 RepID=UPI001356EED6|nr:hypothetical protein [Arthrobacter zhaoguopingii]